MAVEARYHTLFHPQMTIPNTIPNQSITPPGFSIGIGNGNSNGYGNVNPLSATTTAMYCSGFTDSMNGFPASNAPLKAESGLTCSLPVSRKRPRECADGNTLISFVNSQQMSRNQIQRAGVFSVFGEDVSVQMQREQLEIDQFIAQHTEKMRLELEERRKRNCRRLIAAIEEGISAKLRAKEEEIMKLAKLNFALEEKVKSLCVENQIWRELAQSNEATANALRSNLKQVLEQVVHDEYRHRSTTVCVDDAAAEDAQSCCESNNEEILTPILDQDNINDDHTSNNNNNLKNNFNNNYKKNASYRLCKECGKEESSVLLLPCRHLCLCSVCASSVNSCPVCKSIKNISVHVNMS